MHLELLVNNEYLNNLSVCFVHWVAIYVDRTKETFFVQTKIALHLYVEKYVSFYRLYD